MQWIQNNDKLIIAETIPYKSNIVIKDLMVMKNEIDTMEDQEIPHNAEEQDEQEEKLSSDKISNNSNNSDEDDFSSEEEEEDDEIMEGSEKDED